MIRPSLTQGLDLARAASRACSFLFSSLSLLADWPLSAWPSSLDWALSSEASFSAIHCLQPVRKGTAPARRLTDPFGQSLARTGRGGNHRGPCTGRYILFRAGRTAVTARHHSDDRDNRDREVVRCP